MPIYQEFKKGKVTYTVYVSKMIKGIQYRRKKRGVSSLVQAKKIENDLRIDLHNKIHGVKNYTWNEWYEVCMKRMSLQFLKSTMANYKGNMTKWVNGEIGHLNLKDITSEKIHAIIFDKCGNISAEAKRSVLKQIKRFFAMAVDDGLITKNPSRPIKVKVPESTQAILNKSEIDKLLYEGKRQGHQFYNHWALALLTGMRNGELHALTWNDVDLENRVISVTKSWSRVDGIGPTKSTKNRYIPISNELFDFLVELKKLNISNSQYVLEHSQIWDEGRQARILKDFCKSIGVTSIRFHDLRATFITQMLLRNVSLAKVMNIVGHSTIKTTMRYLRLVAQDTRGATEELGITLPKGFKDDAKVIHLFKK